MTRRMIRTDLRSMPRSYHQKSFVINVSGCLPINDINLQLFSTAASVLRMFKSAIGDEAFRSALASYFTMKWVIRNLKLVRCYDSFNFFAATTMSLQQRTCISRSKTQSVSILDLHSRMLLKHGSCKLVIQSSVSR